MVESVAINFSDQKLEIKDKTVSQDNNNKPALNPVKLYAHTVQLLYGYPGFLDKWSIYKFHNGKTFTNISSRKILQDLQASVQCIGPDIIGFTGKDIGTHPLCPSLHCNDTVPREGTRLHHHTHWPLEIRCLLCLH